MLQAIKDLKSENDSLKDQNAALSRALEKQQERLQSIELKLDHLAGRGTQTAKHSAGQSPAASADQ